MTARFGLGWVAAGTLFSIIAILVFRRDGQSKKSGELYLATVGPWFGPVVGVLLLLDVLRSPQFKVWLDDLKAKLKRQNSPGRGIVSNGPLASEAPVTTATVEVPPATVATTEQPRDDSTHVGGRVTEGNNDATQL